MKKVKTKRPSVSDDELIFHFLKLRKVAFLISVWILLRESRSSTKH